ncbi:MAG TPA: hypothetical protein PKW33_08395 [Anaerolineaceae bacterium]|nr:hypothetical protein [Anaerolineaceae bacterium]HPN51593.1 hypothetical protein [Anaerolineaceae bacterium]
MDELSIMDMEENQDNDKPPSLSPRPVKPWRVAVIANVKGETILPMNGPADAGAEFDRRETIQAIQDAIETDGHSTIFLPADSNLPFALSQVRPDICFNIAEGIAGDGREAQVPALLEMLGIPYTASRVQANAISLDKTMTKRIWRDNGLPIAEFQEFTDVNEPLSRSLHFPLFVKPAREGTGMGIDDRSIVYNMRELRERVSWILNDYHQPALVEAYLPGREFTIGVLGRSDAALYSPNPELYGSDGFHQFPAEEIDHFRCVTPGVYSHYTKTLALDEEGVPRFICPAPIDAELALTLHRLAVRAHQTIGAVDISRVDMRMNEQGKPCLIEINTLPGLTPDFSDLCVIANASGVNYRKLILEILYLGASRYGMMEPAAHPIPVMQTRIPEYVALRK